MRLLCRQYLVIAATIVICLIPAIAAISAQEPEYRATTKIYVEVQAPGYASPTSLSQADRAAKNRTITFKELAGTKLILGSVVDELALDVSAEELAPHVTALSALDTAIIQITVSWGEPQQAAEIANAIATRTISLLGSEDIGVSSLHLVQAQPAVVPAGPSSPNLAVILGLAGFGGLLLGVAIVLIRQGMVRRIYSLEHLESVTDYPILGHIRTPSRRRAPGLDVHHLAQTLQSAGQFHGTDTYVVVSTKPTPAKSEFVHRLAAELPDVEMVQSSARLADREPLELGSPLDPALVIVALGQDTTDEFNTMMSQLDLFGVPIAGIVAAESRRFSLRA